MMALARKLTAIKLKQCQQLEPQKHKPDGIALILLSLSRSIRVLRDSRSFTCGLLECAFRGRREFMTCAAGMRKFKQSGPLKQFLPANKIEL
jgi:hypothetical protein